MTEAKATGIFYSQSHMAFNYSRKDFLADSVFVVVLGLLGAGLYHFLKPPLTRAWALRIQRAHRESSPVAEGTAINDSWSVQTLDGSANVPISTLKGKVIFLNFWATWCGPCRMELPSIEKLYQQYKDTDVVFLCVSAEDPLTLQLFVQKHKIQIPVYVSRKIPGFFHATVLPTTFIVSRSGKVALSRAGASQWNKKDIIHLLETLRAGKVTD